jgi:autotransporter translocation and assembly factor TamB
LNEQRFGASELKATLGGKAISLDGKLFQNQVTLNGRLPLRGAGNGKVQLRFNSVRLAPLMALAPSRVSEQVELPLDGRLAGTVTAAGSLSRPQALVADVDLSSLRLAFRDLMLENRGPIKIRYAGKHLTVQSLHLAGNGTDIQAKGALGLGAPSDFTVNGTLNLALLEKLSPKNFADASGTAIVDAKLEGTLGAPDLVGSLALRNGELTSRNLPQSVRDLSASVRLVRDRIFLDRLRATLGYTGHLEAFGGATLGPDYFPKQIGLQLTGRELAVRIPEASVLLNADLAFAGTPEASRLDGQVRVLEGRYTKDIPLTGALAGRRVTRSGGTDLSKIPFVKNLALQVAVSAPDQVVVKNNLADMELRGDLLVLGTPALPAVVGRAETLPGAKILFQDRTYLVEEGTVDFIDPSKLEPYVHLVATTTIQSIDVRLAANGTPAALKLDLKSTPYMDQQDLLTLLATGQTPQQLAQGSGGGGEALSNLLVNQFAKGVERGVGDQGAVDLLRIQPGTSSGGTVSAGSLSVGKRINDRLMITYTQDLTSAPGKTPGRLVIFDYTLTDFMVLKLEQDLGGGFNASARYRYPVR